MQLGAIYRDGRTHFCVWAPKRSRVDLVINGRSHPMRALEGGYFATELSVGPGTRYTYQLDGGEQRPDPCSRFQPDGPHGASEIVDANAYAWRANEWRGISIAGQVFYELHVGTFTPRGDFRGVIEKLPYLRDLGVTCIEIMPVATFPGRFNWGYDGVDLFAPCAVYGRPDDLRRLVDEAHSHGLGVILDVVYNHFGPDGNYLRDFSELYFTDKYPPEWGEAVRFEGPEAKPVRELFTQNAAHWIGEYRLDGLRLDATQALFDDPERHIVADIVKAARKAAVGREVIIVAESESQDARMVRKNRADGIWIDDFHHVTRTLATGSAEGYMQDFHGNARELLACTLSNALYQGQWFAWRKEPRGGNLMRVPHEQIVFFLQNHDQVANSLRGLRLQKLAGARLARTLTTYLLLLPQTPLIFQGEEFFADTPFLFFCDHNAPLMRAVKEGRTALLSQFPSAKHALREEGFELVIGEEALAESRLDWSKIDERALALHKDLLRLRREVVGPELRGAVLNEQALVLRYGESHLVLLNYGSELTLERPSEPLLAPPEGGTWAPLFSSEDTRYGGSGALFPEGQGPWRIGGCSACVLKRVDT